MSTPGAAARMPPRKTWHLVQTARMAHSIALPLGPQSRRLALLLLSFLSHFQVSTDRFLRPQSMGRRRTGAVLVTPHTSGPPPRGAQQLRPPPQSIVKANRAPLLTLVSCTPLYISLMGGYSYCQNCLHLVQLPPLMCASQEDLRGIIVQLICFPGLVRDFCAA